MKIKHIIYIVRACDFRPVLRPACLLRLASRPVSHPAVRPVIQCPCRIPMVPALDRNRPRYPIIELTKTAHTEERPHAIQIDPPRSPSRIPHRRTERLPSPRLPACFVMPCGIQYHQKQLMMSSDVIIDTVPCLPSRPSSRIRPVLISYRIPDDIKTQSITCDI